MADPSERYQKALAFAEQLARQAGEIAKRHYGFSTDFEVKADVSPVSAADIEINRMVIQECQAAYPDAGIIGEEEQVTLPDAKLVWVCDPLDGTLPFTLGIPATTFCLALVEDGEPVVGVVYDFHQDRLYGAIKGGAMLMNGEPVHKRAALQPVVNYEGTARSPYYLPGSKERLFKADYRVLTYCSHAYMALQVAAGHMAGSIYSNSHPWDVAAVKVIAEAAGCRVTDLAGNEQRYDTDIKGAIIARPEHYQAIAQALTDGQAN